MNTKHNIKLMNVMILNFSLFILISEEHKPAVSCAALEAQFELFVNL
jgi:hypothetical protein